jgi:hypothetical protein
MCSMIAQSRRGIRDVQAAVPRTREVAGLRTVKWCWSRASGHAAVPTARYGYFRRGLSSPARMTSERIRGLPLRISTMYFSSDVTITFPPGSAHVSVRLELISAALPSGSTDTYVFSRCCA